MAKKQTRQAKPKTVLVAIRMTEEMRDRYNQISAKWQMSREHCFRLALSEWMQFDQDAPPIAAGIRPQRAKPERFTPRSAERRVRRGPTRPGRKWRTKDRPGFSKPRK